MKNRFIKYLGISLIAWGLFSCDRDVIDNDDEVSDSIVNVDGIASIEDDDNDYVLDSLSIVNITFDGSTITCDNEYILIEGSTVTLALAGTYKLSGTLSDGQVRVNCEDESAVQIILDGVDMTSSTSTPLYIMQAKKTIIILNDETQNTISDAAIYSDEEADPNAAIYSSDDLSIYGAGSLTVNGNYNDGISSKDGLIIKSGNITVNAIDDGIRGKDYLLIESGTITVDAKGDALKSDNEVDASAGIIILEDGDYKLTANDKAISAITSITINEGNYNISSSDDAIHSNGDITLNGGIFSIAASDDAIHADANVEINWAEIDITSAYEGIESALGNIIINDGIFNVTTSDDAFNVAAGGGSNEGGPGRKSTTVTTSSSSYLFQINGGTIYVNAGGDGLDSNDGFEMNGGFAVVSGSSQSNNSPVDVDGSFLINAGFLLATGSSNMAIAPASSSAQNNILVTLNSTVSAGTLLHIEDESGQEILTFKAPKSYNSLLVSSADLVSNEDYKIYRGGSHSGTLDLNIYSDGTYTPGTLVTSFNVSNTTNYIN